MPKLLYIVGGVIGLLILIGILAALGIGRGEEKPAPVTLEMWGFEDERVWMEVIAGFSEQYPHISIAYKRLPADAYDETLVNRLAEGKGPDIFLLKKGRLVRHRDKIAALPAASSPLSPAEMARQFAEEPASALVSPAGELFGLPVFIDSLALFYHKDVFETAGIAQPPATWEKTEEVSRLLTRRAPSGDLIRSGLALGSAKNVNHAMEILSALILQKGDPIVSGRNTALGSAAAEALAFYTSFSDVDSRNLSWTSRMPDSLEAFSEGKAAMAIGFSRDLDRIRAKNPHINLGVAPLPQFSGRSVSRTYADYWFPAVSRLSKNQSAAWQFVFYAAYPEGAKKYAELSGRPPARRDLIAGAKDRTEADVFNRQVLIARSWPVPDEDAGRRIFEEAIESAASRAATPSQAISRLNQKLRLLLP